jgi:hypothetical protein
MNSPVEIVVWDPALPNSEAQLKQVLALHKLNKATLGPMPDAAFRDRGSNRGLVLAVGAVGVVGYTLYDTPRYHTVKLVHVCVGKFGRGASVAKQMIDLIVGANPNRGTLVAACRGTTHSTRSGLRWACALPPTNLAGH